MLITVLLITTLLFGCIGEHKRKTDYMKEAKACFTNRNYICARKALTSAIEIDPDDVEAYANLGETCLRLGDVTSAFTALKKAAKISPDVIPVQIKLATLYLLKGQPETARKILEKILGKSPENINALYLTAGIYSHENDLANAAKTFKKILSADPRQERAILALADITARNRDMNKAVHILETGLAHNPGSTPIRLALYAFYVKTRRIVKAEKLVSAMIARHPDNPRLYIIKGSFLAGQNRIRDAGAAFHRAIRISPESIVPYLSAAMFYDQINRPEQAVSMYRFALSLQPDNPGILLKLGDFYLRHNNVTAAAKYVEKIRTIRPNDPFAMTLDARILMAQKDYVRALSVLSGLISKYPEMDQPLYLNALAHIKAGQSDAAKTSLVKIGPKSRFFIRSRLVLAGILSRERDFSGAIDACNRLISLFPDNLQAHKMLGNIYLAKHDLKSAAKQFTDMIRIDPKDPDGYYLSGMADQLSGKSGAAEKNYKKALDLNPDHMDAFLRLISLLAEKANITDAIKMCDARIAAMKGHPTLLAVVYNLKGKLLVAEKKPTQAERLFKEAMILNPDYLPSYYSLAMLYISEKRTQKAIDHFLVALDRDAHQEGPNMMLGLLYSNENRTTEAILHYKKALEINPGFFPAANNLAYLLAEKGDRLTQALELAKRAKDHLPNDPRIADTLGWVYFRLGLYDDALNEFSQSLSQLPENATVYFHLGMTYFKKGDHRRARDALKRALELNKGFKHADEARKVLSSLS